MIARPDPSVAVHRFRGEAAVVLAAGDYTATFLPDLGMLGASLTWRGAELISLQGGLAAYRGGHTTGLPLLAPWANRLSRRRFRIAGVDVDLRRVPLHLDRNGLPIHGTLTARAGWEVVLLGVRRGRARLVTRFDYGARPDLLAAFPFPHVLGVEASVGDDGLRVETTAEPTGKRPIPVSFGWHPYVHVAGPRGGWTLRVPAREHAELDSESIPTGRSTRERAETLRLGDVELDDLYALGRDRRFVLTGGGRTVYVRFGAGYPFAQLFAPTRKPFVAIEPMTAPIDGLVTGACPIVSPGKRFAATFSLSAR